MTKAQKSPLQQRRKMNFTEDIAQFRAVTEEVEGASVRRLRGYPILFDTPGKPWMGSPWVEKVDKQALDGVDFSKLVILLNHNSSWVLGRHGKNLRAEVDETGLFIEVTLGNTWLDDYVYDRVENELMDGMSFWFDSKTQIATDWENKVDVILKINDVYEVSIVTFPAYDETVIISDQYEESEAIPEEPDDDVTKAALLNLIEAL